MVILNLVVISVKSYRKQTIFANDISAGPTSLLLSNRFCSLTLFAPLADVCLCANKLIL